MALFRSNRRDSRDSTASSSQVRRPFPLRDMPIHVRAMLLATAAILATVGILVVVASLLINNMKNEMVEVAHAEVREKVEHVKEEIERIVAEQEAAQGAPVHSLSEVAHNPGVKTQLRVMTSSGAVVLSALIDREGNCVYQQYGEETRVHKRCPLTEEQTMTGIVPEEAGPLTWEVTVREYPDDVTPQKVAVESRGETIGYIEYGLEESLALKQLDPISASISRSLTLMAGLVILCMGVAIYLLNRVWDRHLELQSQHGAAQHMAMIGTMASGLAHEIRNPLHAMNLHLDSAREELEDPREDSVTFARDTLSSVQRQITGLNDIVSNFMNFALPHDLEKEPIRLAPIVKDVARLLQPEFERRQVAIESSIPEQAWVLGDQTALRQVLTNVLLNAAQALENSGTRRVGVSARASEAGRWVVTIDDTGPGIPPGKEESIFEVFQSGRKGGSGFGLAIARRIMEEHGGSITGRNRREGGARFMLDLPATEQPEDYEPSGVRSAVQYGDDGEPVTIG